MIVTSVDPVLGVLATTLRLGAASRYRSHVCSGDEHRPLGRRRSVAVNELGRLELPNGAAGPVPHDVVVIGFGRR